MKRLITALTRIRLHLHRNYLADIDPAAIDHFAEVHSRGNKTMTVEQYIQYLLEVSNPRTFGRIRWAINNSDLVIVPSEMTLGDYSAYTAARDRAKRQASQ